MITELAGPNVYENWLAKLMDLREIRGMDHQGKPSLSILFELRL